jgi:large subunit ribosomal protein L32
MTPLPKRKHSKGRTRRRRAHDFLTQIRLIECTSCHQPHIPHQVCPACGKYDGRTALKVEAEAS